MNHVRTNYNLHSQGINYGSGSGQKVVSTIYEANNPNSLWIIKEAYNEPPCATGRKIRCGEKIRLEHISSGKNLHSDKSYKSPFSNNQEVSLFGYNGNGDKDDDWVIECTNGTQEFLKGGSSFLLRHAETNKYLYSDNEHIYNQKNCKNCPILGQGEVSAIR